MTDESSKSDPKDALKFSQNELDKVLLVATANTLTSVMQVVRPTINLLKKNHEEVLNADLELLARVGELSTFLRSSNDFVKEVADAVSDDPAFTVTEIGG